MPVLYCSSQKSVVFGKARVRLVKVEAFEEAGCSHSLSPTDWDLLICNGWGDVKQSKIPKDWRTRINEKKAGDKEFLRKKRN